MGNRPARANCRFKRRGSIIGTWPKLEASSSRSRGCNCLPSITERATTSPILNLKRLAGQNERMKVLVRVAVPIACWWACYHEARILKEGVLLTAGQLETAQKMGILH